jgi:hypothetical protein
VKRLKELMTNIFGTATTAATAQSIRRELRDVGEQVAVETSQRDDVALDALTDKSSAARWTALNESVQALERRAAVLKAALPAAEQREQREAEAVEARRRTEALAAYRARTAEVRTWVDGLLTRLPSAEELTRARDLRDELRDDARELAWSNDIAVRRTADPLDDLVRAMAWRIERVNRAKHATDGPIHLDAGKEARVREAAARVEKVQG